MAVTNEAIYQIRGMILSGVLAPGDRLPPEKELSEQLGISRNSLREAVKALELIRVLDVRRGDGTYVTSLEPSLVLEAISFVIDLHDDSSVLEMFAVRRILEPAAASMAAARISPDAAQELRAMVDAMGDVHAVGELVDHDTVFHRAIAAEAGNSYLAGLIDSLSSGTLRSRIWRGITEVNVVSRTLSEHAAIAAAIAAGDQELAHALTLSHISGVEHWIRIAL